MKILAALLAAYAAAATVILVREHNRAEESRRVCAHLVQALNEWKAWGVK